MVWKNDKSQLDWRKVIKRCSLTFFDNHAQYWFPYHKADPFYCGSDVLFNSHEVADPVSLLLRYVNIRDRIHGARAALFLTQDGSIPTRSWWDSKFSNLLDRRFGGQSPHAGGATFYTSLGIQESIIQALGRWSSAAWKIYIRENPSIRVEQQLAYLQLRHLL